MVRDIEITAWMRVNPASLRWLLTETHPPGDRGDDDVPPLRSGADGNGTTCRRHPGRIEKQRIGRKIGGVKHRFSGKTHNLGLSTFSPIKETVLRNIKEQPDIFTTLDRFDFCLADSGNYLPPHQLQKIGIAHLDNRKGGNRKKNRGKKSNNQYFYGGETFAPVSENNSLLSPFKFIV